MKRLVEKIRELRGVVDSFKLLNGMECVIQTWADGDVYISFYGIKVHYYYNRDYVTVELDEELINDDELFKKRVENLLSINFESILNDMKLERIEEMNQKLNGLYENRG